jgi:hypothetical protein
LVGVGEADFSDGRFRADRVVIVYGEAHAFGNNAE